MIFTDQRFKPFIVSTIFMCINLIVFLFGQFDIDYSLFGTNLDSNLISKLSFDSSNPFHWGGLNLVTSVFIHQNLNHFLINTFFFIIIAFNTEKLLSKIEFIFFVFLSHSTPLLLSAILIDGPHLFLGKSIICYSLFSLFSLISARHYLFAIILTLTSLSLIFDQPDWFSVGMHLSGLLFGVLYFYINTKLLRRRYKTN